ncbi:hypothetical protein I9Y31_003468 [Clostridium perfringens]|nr:hypothetical protein [Clostridium perfringens]HAT4312744.1 hypothetical protein [Clostridium perfringens]
MIDVTYEDALITIDKLINRLEKDKEFETNNEKERYLIIDALSLLETKLEKELELHKKRSRE